MRIKKKCVRCEKENNLLLGQNTFLGCQSCGCFEIRLVCEEDLLIKCTECGEERIIHPGEIIKGVHSCGSCFWSVYSIEEPKEEELQKEEIKEVVKEEIKEVDAMEEVVRDVTGIVVCHNELGLTKKCIELLKNTICSQIVLVDNGSTDETQEWAKRDKDIVYIRNQINLGCGIGRNQGAKYATGEYLFFIDNDQFVPSEVVSRMLVLNKDLVGTDLWRVRGGRDSVPVDFDSVSVVQKDMYVGSGGMLVRKKVFDALKGYDERFAPAWYEDTDFCFRVKKGGYSIEYLHEAGIEHIGNQTIKKQTTFSSDKAKSKGQDLFFELWNDYLKEDNLNKFGVRRRKTSKVLSLKEHAKANLIDMKKILDGLGIMFWLDAGTLLGAYRDKDFCENDEDDIDLCTWDEFRIYIPEILGEAQQKGFSVYHQWQSEGESYQIAVKRNGVKVDLFFNMKNKKEDIAYIYLYRGEKPDKKVVIPLRFYEQFAEIEFLGETFLMPKDIEGYLTAKYGDWKIKMHRREYSCYKVDHNKFVEEL